MKFTIKALTLLMCLATVLTCFAACASKNKGKIIHNDENIDVQTNSGENDTVDDNNVTNDIKYAEYTDCEKNYLFRVYDSEGKTLSDGDMLLAEYFLSIGVYSDEYAERHTVKLLENDLMYVGADSTVTPEDIIGYAEKCAAHTSGLLHFRNSDDEIVMDHTSVKEASFTFTMEDGVTFKPIVQLTLTPEGEKLFAEVTEVIAQKPKGENYLAIYIGENLISQPTVEEKITGNSVIISSPDFEKEESEAKRLASIINLNGKALDFKLEFHKEIQISQEVINDYKKDKFLSALAVAITEKTGRDTLPEYIDKAMLEKYTSFVYTVYEDRSELNKDSNSNGPYYPAVVLGTEEFTEYYVNQNYLSDLAADKQHEDAEEEIIPDHLVIFYEFDSLDVLEMFSNLEVLQFSGYTTRNTYSYYQYYYHMYSMYGYSAENNPAYMPCYSLESFKFANDMTQLTSLDQIPNIEKIKYLSLGYSGIDSLDGIEKATSIEYLEVAGCGLEDIKALESVSSIKRINLAYNSLTSLEGIENNKDLVVVSVDNNQLTSLEPLNNTTAITSLSVAANALTDLNGIEGNAESLKTLYAGDCVDNEKLEAAEESAEEESKEEGEEEEDNKLGRTLADISAIEGFTALETLDISGNVIADISCVSTMSALKTLTASDNLIASLPEDLSGAKKLETITVDKNEISSIGGVGGAPALKTLTINDNKLTSLDGIGASKTITTITADKNEISELGDIDKATTITSISLSENKIADISALAALKEMTTLNLENNEIAELKDLSALTKLTTLNLGGNKFESIDTLGALKKVETLDLSDNEALTDISDFNKIFDAATLKSCDFSITPETDEDDKDDDKEVDTTNTVIENWSSLMTFSKTTFTGIPKEVQDEIKKYNEEKEEDDGNDNEDKEESTEESEDVEASVEVSEDDVVSAEASEDDVVSEGAEASTEVSEDAAVSAEASEPDIESTEASETSAE